MADDRHEAFRQIYGSSAITKLLEEFPNLPSGYVVYQMLMVKEAHPDWKVPAIINETRRFLNGEH